MQTIFWSPEVLPTVLRAAAATWTTFSRPCRLDLGKLSSADLRQASDGWHAVLRLGGKAHRLWLQELPAKDTPIVLELLLEPISICNPMPHIGFGRRSSSRRSGCHILK